MRTALVQYYIFLLCKSSNQTIIECESDSVAWSKSIKQVKLHARRAIQSGPRSKHIYPYEYLFLAWIENGITAARTVVIITVPAIIFAALVALTCSLFYYRKPKQETKDLDENSSTECSKFNFETIRLATNDFSDHNKLGQGGFGTVYKGVLSNGRVVAVKRLTRNSKQGGVDFKNEVMLVARLQHRNLVRLLGFCSERNERLLIYEYVPNSSLDHFIYDQDKRLLMDWNTRYKIIVGIARGILYLHEDSQLRIIYRDLKVSNILLDEKMNPKISDFGTARLFPIDQSEDATSKIVGTL
ncbi:cysteine-rich receptor-like protein kinase 37 [Hevea brasiliensis]|uniref:cysteine-rich receptor-like protein kinase 37 n=1 Tax=Hevea brasiliensis TaxID=3981 RepID=UPI0025F82032|nr:cysteine-rich receptor-like protein kinase 37 [Hevea brasiliensis]